MHHPAMLPMSVWIQVNTGVLIMRGKQFPEIVVAIPLVVAVVTVIIKVVDVVHIQIRHFYSANSTSSYHLRLRTRVTYISKSMVSSCGSFY